MKDRSEAHSIYLFPVQMSVIELSLVCFQQMLPFRTVKCIYSLLPLLSNEFHYQQIAKTFIA